MKKSELELKLKELKYQRTNTRGFIDELCNQLESANRNNFSARALLLSELIQSEQNYLTIINVKISTVTNQLSKFN